MVTRPVLTGCLYGRWLPFCSFTNQPSRSTSFMMSRYFMLPLFVATAGATYFNESCNLWIPRQVEKLDPQPQLLVELGLMKLKPWRMRVSSKSRTMPAR